MTRTGVIYGINGPVIYLKGNTGFQMGEMVYVGNERLVGEVISLDEDTTTIQVFEETTGLRPGETVEASGDAISVLLGPGILNNIFDGIERPLSEIAKASGKYISRGVNVDSLDTKKLWDVHVTVRRRRGFRRHGHRGNPGIPGHRTPQYGSSRITGSVTEVVPDGQYTITDTIVTISTKDEKPFR